MADIGLKLDGGFLPNVPPNATSGAQNAALNSVIDRLNNLLKTQTFSDGTTKRYIQGYVKGRFPAGDFGVAISPAGLDVTTCDFNSLLFAWDYTTNIQYFKGGSSRYIDTANDNRILTGFDPNTGKPAIYMTKDTFDVLEEI